MPKKHPSTHSGISNLILSPEDREFRKVFWAARLAHGSVRSGEDGAASTKHVDACQFGIKMRWKWVAGLLDASSTGLSGHLQEANHGLDQIQNEIPAQHRCLVVFLRASLAYLAKDHTLATKLCQDLLSDASFDRRGYVLTNMGESYLALKEPSLAIKCYKDALNEKDYDSPAYALNNLGRLLLLQGDNKGAITSLQRAIAAPPEHVRSEGLYYLGCAFRNIRDRKRAISCFVRSLENPAPNEWFQLQSARALIEMRTGGDQDIPLSSDDLSLLKWKGDPALRDSSIISPEVRAAVKIFRAKETQYDKYMRLNPSSGNGELHILRGWSSAVTLIEGSQRRWRGGGYFIKWKEQGIVIDPGFDFLRNFHDAGFHAREINSVIVTHNHPDHNADLKSIDDLRYEVHNRQGEDPIPPYDLLLDEDTRTAESWSKEPCNHRRAAVLLDHGRCNPTSRFRPEGAEYAVQYFPVRHGDDVPNAVGFCLELYDGVEMKVRVGFTADTEYFAELPSFLSNCDILIGHISQPSVEELHNVAERKKTHLGYRGLIELVRLAKPRLTLVGEFWAGLEDLRIDLVDGVRKMSTNANVFPTSINMVVSLESGRICCSTCRTPVFPEKVRVTPATELFGSLGYYCPACTLG